MSYTLICPPVNAFSSPDEIRALLQRLESMPLSPERDHAIQNSKKMLELSEGLYANLNGQPSGEAQ